MNEETSPHWMLVLVDKFPYLGSSVSSTENDISMELEKAWFAIDKLIWKSDLSDLPTPPLGQDMTQGQFLCGV